MKPTFPMTPLRTATFTLVLTHLVSCGGSDPETAATEQPKAPAAAVVTAPTHGPPISGTSSRGTFALEVIPKGGPIPMNEPFGVMVRVTDPASGAPFTDFDTITLDARMPAHDHGLTRDVTLVATGEPGEFEADGILFHMIGHWEFHVDITQGPRMERAQVSKTLEF